MSLINEALKRAKEAQESAPAGSAPVPHLARFQPAHSHPTSGLLPPVTIAVVAMLGLIVIWQWIHMRNARVITTPTRLVAAAEAKSTKARPPAPVPTSAAPTAQPLAKTAVPSQPARPVPVPVPVPPPSATKTAPSTQQPPQTVPVATPSSSVGKAASNAASVAKEPAPQPVVLRLQAIVTHPTRPSAVINGKSVFVGDHISEFRVVSITRQNVTVVKAGRSTVLTLSE